MDSSNEDRLTNLEIIFTQQEDTVETLSRIVHEQRLQLEQLQQQVRVLQEKITWSGGEEMASEQDETPPPHY